MLVVVVMGEFKHPALTETYGNPLLWKGILGLSSLLDHRKGCRFLTTCGCARASASSGFETLAALAPQPPGNWLAARPPGRLLAARPAVVAAAPRRSVVSRRSLRSLLNHR